MTGSGRFTFSADVARDGKLHYALRVKHQRMEMVQASDSVYMRANSAFWRANGALGASTTLAGRWIEAPAARSTPGRGPTHGAVTGRRRR